MLSFREVNGETVAFMLAEPPDDAPPEIREGIARRNLVAMGEPCPCGARFVMPNRAARRRATRNGEACRVTVEHDGHCPAVTANLHAAIARWRR